MKPLIIAQTGVCSPLGTRAWQTASSVEAKLSRFSRQPIPGQIEHKATVSTVSFLDASCSGVDRLIGLAAPALQEALGGHEAVRQRCRPIPLFIALPEARADVPGHVDPPRFALELPRALDMAADYLPLKMYLGGGVAGADALAAAYRFMHDHPEVPEVLVGGVDSLSDHPVVQQLYAQGQVKVNRHRDGFIASEAAAFVRLARVPHSHDHVTVYPPAFATEGRSRLGSQDILTGDGLIQSVEQALQSANMPGSALHSYWSDVDGSPWRGSELTGLSAAMRSHGGLPSVREPAAFLGEIGAAWVPLLLSLFHEMRQVLHHPFMPAPLAGHGAIQSVTDHGTRVAAWVATWSHTRHVQAAAAA